MTEEKPDRTVPDEDPDLTDSKDEDEEPPTDDDVGV